MQISYIGMQTVEVAIKPVVKITLKPDTEVLDEVVVTGYGNFKKSSFTGAASSITTEKLQDVPSLSVQDKLAGSVAGVQITSTSGQPGAVESVRIRGMGSINAGNDPLYVIDGVPVMTGDASEFTYSQSGNSLLSTINSNDIESMTVIKDAAAASLYGSRAANGVIVITTKKGASGKLKLNVRADWGFSNKAIDYRPILNGEDRRDILYMGLKNYALNSGKDETYAVNYADNNIDKYAAKPWSGYTDWEDVLFRNGSHQNYEVNAQGGNERTKFYTSFGYTKQEGITLQSGYERITGRANMSHKADRVTIEASTMFTNSTQNVNSEGTSFSSPIMCLAMTASPSTFPYNEDGTFSTSFPALNGANPLQTATYNYDRSTIVRTLNTLSATWNIWDNLNIKETLGYDFNQTNNRVWWDPRSNDGRSSKGVFQRYMMNRSKLNTQTQLTYNKTFAEHHNIDVLLGFETEDYKYDYTYTNGNTYPSYLPEITNAGVSRGASNINSYRMTSYLGRLNYDYAGKYYVSGSFRRDGSSRLSRDSRWGNFWSVGASWRIDREDFMVAASDWLSALTLKVSYGAQGNDNLGTYYASSGLYSVVSNNGENALVSDRLATPKLKWETNLNFNAGIDFSLFNNRFSGSFDFFQRRSKDLLYSRPLAPSLGYNSVDENVGELKNTGVEIDLKGTLIHTRDFMWRLGLNLTHYKNVVTDLPLKDMPVSGVHKLAVGRSVYDFYMKQWAGVDPENGDPLWYKNVKDANDKITGRTTTNDYAQADYYYTGKSSLPKVYGGFNTAFSYKGFELSTIFAYSIGNYIVDRDVTMLWHNGSSTGRAWSTEILNRWTPENRYTDVPALKTVSNSWNANSTRNLFNNSFLRMKNITLSYNFPQPMIKKISLNSLQLFVQADNLLTVSKNQGLDPEQDISGLTYYRYPAMRSISGGINVSF